MFSRFIALLPLILLLVVEALAAPVIMPGPLLEARSASLENIPVYGRSVAVEAAPLKRQDQVGGTIPAEKPTKSVNGVISAYGTREVKRQEDGGAIPAEIPTKGVNGIISAYNAREVKRQEVGGAIPVETPSKGVNGVISEYGARNVRRDVEPLFTRNIPVHLPTRSVNGKVVLYH